MANTQIGSIGKHWSKLKTDEKIERMREIIKQNSERQNYQGNQLEQLKGEFTNHFHKEDKLCKEIKKHLNSGSIDSCNSRKEGSVNSNEVYF